MVKAVGKTVLPDEKVRSAHFEKRLNDIPDQSVLIIVFDACRYDTFNDIYDNEFPSEVRKAYSQTCWTIPGHECLVRGALPYTEEQRPYDALPDNVLKGYYPLPLQYPYSFGSVAMPYLSANKYTANRLPDYFDDWFCAKQPTSAEQVTEHAQQFLQDVDDAFFGLINYGETHFPYREYSGEFSDLIDDLEAGRIDYDTLHQWQRDGCRELIQQVAQLRKHLPEDTRVILTADHGELLGENDGYGHNPAKQAVFHEKLFEVPLLTWNETATDEEILQCLKAAAEVCEKDGVLW